MKHNILLFYTWLVRTILFFLPDIPIVMRFRGFLYGLGMRSCGTNFQVAHDTIIRGLQNLKVGSNCFIGNGSIILGVDFVFLEDEVLIAPNVVIVSGNHSSENGSYRYAKGKRGEIHIGYGSWVAANSTIQKDSKLPSNSVLSSNSFLNKKFNIPNSIYGGVPAKLIKTQE